MNLHCHLNLKFYRMSLFSLLMKIMKMIVENECSIYPITRISRSFLKMYDGINILFNYFNTDYIKENFCKYWVVQLFVYVLL